MKRFTSILCALCVMLGAWAVPQDKALREALASRHDFAGAKVMKSLQVGKKAVPAKNRVRAARMEAFNIDFENPMTYKYSSWYGQWNLKAENDEYRWYSDVDADSASTTIAGTYATEDFDLPSYCYLYDKAAEKKIIPAEISAEIAEDEGRIDVEIDMTDSVGNTYSITMFYEPPTAESQVNFTATNLEISTESFWGFTWTTLTAGDYELGIELSYDGEEEFVGTFEIGEELSGDLTVDSVAVEIYSGTITVELTEDGYHVTGSVLGMNSVEYILDLTYVLPDATRTGSITVANGEMYNYLTDYGVFQLYGQTADKAILLTIVSDQVAGTYTKADLYPQLGYSYILEVPTPGDTLFLVPLTANFTVTMDAAGAITCTGTMRVQNYEDESDVVDYTFSLAAEFEGEDTGLDYDEKDADFTENFDTYVIDNQYLAQYGDLMISSERADGVMIYLDLYIPSGTSELAAGTYTVADTEEAMTAYAGFPYEGYVYPSFAATSGSDGYLANIWFLVSGTVTVAADGKITVNALNSYGKAIHSVLAAPTAVENVAADAVAAKRIVNGQLIIEHNGEIFNAQGIRQ